MTDGSIISTEIITVVELSCRRNVQVVGEMSVDEMYVGEMSVGEISGQRNVCRRNVLVPVCPPRVEDAYECHITRPNCGGVKVRSWFKA